MNHQASAASLDAQHRLRLLSEFDPLILRSLLLEMGVETFAPNGLAAEVLSIVRDNLNQRRSGNKPTPPELIAEVVQPRNNHLINAPASDGQASVSGKGGKPVKRKKRVQNDPWDTFKWREEILRFAATHNWRFVVSEYKPIYDAKRTGMVLSSSRVYGTLNDLVGRMHLATKLKDGGYQINQAGRKYAAEEFRIGTASSGKSSAQKNAPKKKTVVRSKPGLTRDLILKYARNHGGRVVVKDLRRYITKVHGREPSGGALYETLNKPDLFEKIGEGTFLFRDVKQPESERPAEEKQPEAMAAAS